MGDERAMDVSSAHAPTPRAWASLLCLGLIWGGSFTTTGYAVAALPPLTVAAARLIVGAAALAVLAAAYRLRLPTLRDASGRTAWAFALLVAIAANSAPFALLAWAQTIVPSGVAGVYMACLPLVVLPLAARFVPGERLTLRKMAGFLLGTLGVVWLIAPAIQPQEAEIGAGWTLLAQLACLAAASGYAIGSVATKRAPPIHPIAFAAMAIGLAAILSTVLAVAFEAPLAAGWTPDAALAILALGIGPTALAMLLLLDVLRRTGPSFLSLVNYQVPLWAMLFGVLFLGETLSPRAPVALAAILAGVALAQGVGKGLFRSRAAAP